MIRLTFYALAPLFMLLFLACFASVLAYGLLRFTGDVLPLNKVVSKITLLLLLLSIFPLKKILKFSWSDLGFAPRTVFFKQMGQGLMLALATLLPVLLTLYLLDVHIWDTSRNWTMGKIAGKIGLALFFAMLIALGEEILFRGLLMTGLRRKMPLIAAVGISSFYYAALHFLNSYTQVPFEQQTIATGLLMVADAFANWFNPLFVSALISLFVVGVFLAVIRNRTPQSLGLCIGCHAGWVWQIKVSNDLFNINPQTDYLYLVSTYNGVVGPLVSIWLVLAMLVYCRQRPVSDRCHYAKTA